MRNISQLVVSMTLLASQAHAAVPAVAAANTSVTDSTGVLEVRLNTNTAEPVQIQATKPDFDTDVLAPLRAAQAKAQADRLAAQKTAAAKARLTAAKKTPVIVAGSDAWAQLRYCEAGGDYTRNSGNGYYGAYQFNIGTWANYGGYSRPDLAPPAVQDAKAQATQAARGWSPWPACSRKLGLM